MRASRQVVEYDAFPELTAMRARSAQRARGTRLILFLIAALAVALVAAAVYLAVWLIGAGAHAVASQGNRETNPDFTRQRSEAPAPMLNLRFPLRR